MCPCGLPRPCVDSQIKKKTNKQHKRNVKIMALQILFSNQEGWVKFTGKNTSSRIFVHSIRQPVTDFSNTSCYKSQQLLPARGTDTS